MELSTNVVIFVIFGLFKPKVTFLAYMGHIYIYDIYKILPRAHEVAQLQKNYFPGFSQVIIASIEHNGEMLKHRLT